MSAINEFGIAVDEFNAATPARKRDLLCMAKREIQARLSELKDQVGRARSGDRNGHPLTKAEVMRLQSRFRAEKMRASRLDAALAALKVECKESNYDSAFVQTARRLLDEETYRRIEENAARA